MRLRWLVALLILFPLCTSAQEANQAVRRPKIGLALEGGGAKGIAHIGVLKWFEEHHIPIDYIAGTSMGGLVGGLYATGMRPKELQEFVSAIDWNEILGPQLSYQDYAFRRKQDLHDFPGSIVLGLRNGLSLPGGLNSGYQVTLLLDRQSLPYSDLKSFDDLPIPFRCVATDLVTEKPKVFQSGSLGTALRSTMSLPAVFAPIQQGGQVYADGGLLENLPVQAAKQMGADVVIGVHLSTGPYDPKDAVSLLGVAGRSIDVVIDANVLRSMEMADVLLTVDVAGYSTLDFEKFQQILPKGYEAAQAKDKLLSTFSVDDATWQQYLEQRESRRVKSVPTPQFVKVEGTSPRLAASIQQKLSDNVGQPLDFQRLRRSLDLIMGNGRYDSISYGLVERDGKPGLSVIAQEKPYAPPTLRFGVEVDGSQPSNVQFSLGARVTFLDLGAYRSELRTDFSFGSVYAASAEYYHPLKPSSRWFISPQAGARNGPLDVYSFNTLLAQYRVTQLDLGFDLGYAFDRFSELRLGYQLGYERFSRLVGIPEFPSGGARTGATRLRYALNMLDDPVIPRSGIELDSSAEWVDSNPAAHAGFPVAAATFQWYKPVSRPASIYLVGSGGTTFGHNQVGFPPFALGGPLRLAAYGVNEYLTNQYVYFRGGFLRQVGQLPTFAGSGIYITGYYELAKVYNIPGVSELPNDGAVAVVMNTFIGPVFVGGAIGDTGHHKWFFGFGRYF